jgi:hypothetical protein
MKTVGSVRFSIRVSITVIAAVTLAVLFGTVVVQAQGSDFSGKLTSQVLVHPTSASSGPIAGQWNDGQAHLLPGTSLAVKVPKHKSEYLTIATNGTAGILCSQTQPEFSGAVATLDSSSGQPIPLNFAESGAIISPTLAAGNYTLGLSAQCFPPDDVNNPAATFQVGSGYVSAQVVAGAVESVSASSGPIGSQWNDGQVHFLPGTALSFTVPKSQFLMIATTTLAGISCSPSKPEFTSAFPVLENSSGQAISLIGSAISPLLAPGTYTLGMSAQCAPPDDVSNPGATYQVDSGYMTAQFVAG